MLLPSAARDFRRAVAVETRGALVSVRRSWRRMSPEFDVSWEAVVGRSVLAATVAAQDAVAAEAGRYVPRVLEQTGQRVADLDWEPDPQAWGGTAGDGRSVQSLAYGGVARAKQAVAAGATTHQALVAGGAWLTQALGTVIADTARSAETTHAQGRRKTMYVRMLNPPSCGRCVILAGRSYHTAFERHPGCDCLSIPSSENVAGDLLTDPREYLDHLGDDELAKALGSRANAAAYREHGADMNQLVNAYRARWLGDGRHAGSVSKAQVYGRSVRYTTEGVTRRGWAGQSMRRAGYVQDSKGRLKTPRLMPESIFDIAEDRADAQRLLRLYGWVR